jgi:hypothetical protein
MGLPDSYIMEENRPLSRVARYNPPTAELVLAYFLFGLLSVLFSFYLESQASPEFIPSTGQAYLVQFDQPSWGPDEVLVRYATYAQMIVWTTLRVATDITLVLGAISMLWTVVIAGLRKRGT